MNTWKSLELLSKICISILILLFGYLAYHAYYLTAHYFDSYTIFNNAKAIAQGNGPDYEGIRAPLLSLLISPLFRLGNVQVSLLFARYFMVVVYFFYVYSSYKVFRCVFRQSAAISAVTILSLNSLFIHYSFFVKEDLLGALFLNLTMLFYIKSRITPKISYFLLTGLFISSSALCKYNLGPVILLTIFIHELFLYKKERCRILKWCFYFIFPVMLFLVIPGILYAYLYQANFIDSIVLFIESVRLASTYVITPESSWQNYEFLSVSFTLPLIILFIVGLIISIKKRNSDAMLFAVWFFVFFLIQTYVIRHKEARYLFPVFLPMVYFIMIALKEINGSLKRFIRRDAIRNLLILLLLSVYVGNAFVESARFQDPFYRNTIVNDVSRTVKQLAGKNDIYWIGNMYALHPKDYIFHLEDEFAYVYHFSANAVKLLTGKEIKNIFGSPKISASKENKGLDFVKNLGDQVKDGDVIIVNVEQGDYQTKNMPKVLHPLIVQKVKIVEFDPTGKSSNDRLNFQSTVLSDSSIKMRELDGKTTIQGLNIPNGTYELYLESKRPYHFQKYKRRVQVFEPMDIKNGVFEFSTEMIQFEDLKSLFLLTFEHNRKY